MNKISNFKVLLLFTTIAALSSPFYSIAGNSLSSISITSKERTWYTNEMYDITWTCNNNNGQFTGTCPVSVFHKTNGKEYYIGASNRGRVVYTVPDNVFDRQYASKILLKYNGSVWSTRTHHILRSEITAITSPKKQERWVIGSPYKIEWNYIGNPRYYKLVLGGLVNPRDIALNIQPGSDGRGSIPSYTVPLDIPKGSSYVINAVDSEGNIKARSEIFQIDYPDPTLTSAEIIFETTDDDKNLDSTARVYVRTPPHKYGSDDVIYIAFPKLVAWNECIGSGEIFQDNSIKQISLEVNTDLKKSECMNLNLSVGFAPFTADTWRFRSKLKLHFSDGSGLLKRSNGIDELSQSCYLNWDGNSVWCSEHIYFFICNWKDIFIEGPTIN